MNRAAATLGVVFGAVALGLIVWRGAPALEGQAGAQQPGGEKAAPVKRTLNAEGTATVRVKADRGRVFLSVQTTAATVKEARAENAAHVKKVMTAIQALKLPDLKMTSTDIHLNAVHETKKDETPRLVGYRVTHWFTALVRDDDPAKLGAAAARVVDVAMENSVTSLQKVVFFKEDLTGPRREALTKATEDAVASARALAAGAGRTLADVVVIQESADHYPRASNSQVQVVPTLLAEGSATPLIAGELEVSCSVRVTCTYGPEKK